MKNSQNNFIEGVGNTPLVKLQAASEITGCNIYGKAEYLNPGGSVKDRAALALIRDAEEKKLISKGGTIVEGTAGNTGIGLCLIGNSIGYKTVIVMNDNQTQEKKDMLKNIGADLRLVPPKPYKDDGNYVKVAGRLADELKSSNNHGVVWANQFDNTANSKGHYESTGPEIWEQTEGKITHLVVGVGTGGTISGTAKYLKEKNPNIKVWGIDTFGSVFKKYHETGEFDENEIYPYITEGIGEDILPKNVDFSLIDHFEKVTDKDGAIMARRISREEGIMVGYSAGSAVAGVNQLKDNLKQSDVVVIIFHDHGTRYVGKLFNDDWMKSNNFI